MDVKVKGKKMFLIFHGRFPGEKAAAVFAGKSAEAFAEIGFDVILIAPRRLHRSAKTAVEYYGIKNNFRVVYLPTIDLFSIPVLKNFAFRISLLFFSIFLYFYFLFSARRDDIIYSNETLPLLFTPFWFRNVFFEIHDFPKKSFLNRRLFGRIKMAIATNRWKQKEIAKIFKISEEKILFEPNAVDLAHFKNTKRGPAQAKLFTSSDTVLLGYMGALKTMGMEKGVTTLLEAVAILPKQFRCLIIGGSREDVSAYEKHSEEIGIKDRMTFTGWVRHSDVADYLTACDILVAPFPKYPHYEFYMSPMKIFEYMASGKPIVATDLHSIREIAGDDAILFVPPDNSNYLAKGIEQAFSVKDVSAERVAKSLEIMKEHTWTKRAERIAGRLIQS